MTNKTLHNLFGFAAKEKAKKVVISGSKTGLAFNCHLPDGEEAIFNIPKNLETDLAANLRRLLEIAPGELASGKYCKLSDKNYHLNFRLSIVPDKFGEKIIINIIDEKKSAMALNKLGLQKEDLITLKTQINNKTGLIIISSPEMQGRSSTLNSLLTEINKEDKNIYFINDGLENQLPGINYVDNGLNNWAAILKQNSDIIILDVKNGEAHLTEAINAASTGRLVIITLEAINGFEALYKILNNDLPLKLKLDSLRMITGQALIDLKRPKNKNGKISKNKRKKIGIFEILIINKKIKNFILNNQEIIKTETFWNNLLQIFKENEYKPLAHDAQRKKHNGLI